MLVFDTQPLLESRDFSYGLTGGSLMPRPLTVRKPSPAEVRELQQVLEADDSTAAQRRRAEILLFYSNGWNAVEIATGLSLHPNTVYAVLHAFGQNGLTVVESIHRGGAPPRLTPDQCAAIARIADQPPSEFGLPLGRWSLAKLRGYLIDQGILRTISREHLRRILKKRGSDSGAFSRSCTAEILSDPRF